MPLRAVESICSGDCIARPADFRVGLADPRRRRLAEQADHEHSRRDRGRDQQHKQNNEASTQ